MKQRVITAVVALALFIPIVWYGGWAFELTVAFLAVIGVHELFKMNGLRLMSMEGVLSAAGAVALLLPREKWFFFLPRSMSNFHLFYLTVLLLLCMAVFSKNTYTFENAAFPVLVSLYVGVGFQSFVAARGNGSEFLYIIYGLAVVWATDIGAYMIGRKIGKHKLAPHISPNKTVEGSVGGVICAVAAACLIIFVYPSETGFNYPWTIMLVVTVIMSLAGQMGDLVESAFKRHFGVKDSGNILPGHGGILDRFDSLLFVFPLMSFLGIF
ncbi:phosphatidate cytidylyltransferase [Vagococcus elongatus]|uniref:Phosphatidate cytidylyltransferase n=1 Tax=Vagococcus elongatus TaxID=180344 RepID=A0A430AM00_9ENTE|nr:phosphatidate cytidylyltransferase [Vagococcus elongatus]RSU08963.1 phosphatidate cytidylyltransferase [Vagococcus elongatus]